MEQFFNFLSQHQTYLMYGFYALIYIATCYGLYVLMEEFGEENTWFSFIPFLNFYTFIKAGELPGFLSVIYLLSSVGGAVIKFQLLPEMYLGLFVMGLLVVNIIAFVVYIVNLSKISSRAGYQGIGTFGMVILGVLLLPLFVALVNYKVKH